MESENINERVARLEKYSIELVDDNIKLADHIKSLYKIIEKMDERIVRLMNNDKILNECVTDLLNERVSEFEAKKKEMEGKIKEFVV